MRRIKDLRNHSEPWVTTTDLADYWRVSRKQIYKQIDAGTLKAIRLGPRLLRISLAAAIRFEEAAKMSASPDEERACGPVPRLDNDHLEGVTSDTVADLGATERLEAARIRSARPNSAYRRSQTLQH